MSADPCASLGADRFRTDAARLRRGDVLSSAAGPITLVTDPHQRLWSRVAEARDADGRSVFVKQFVQRDGTWRPDQWDYELTSSAVAADRFSALSVPTPVHASADELVLCYPFRTITPFDAYVRAHGTVEAGRWSACLDKLVTVCAEARLEDGGSFGDLPVREVRRPVVTRGLCFTGLEVRNLALDDDEPDALVAFDLGHVHVACVEDLAARLLGSVLLLNWGRPVGRFRAGPAADLFEPAVERMAPYVTRDALETEMVRQFTKRARDVRDRRDPESLAKRMLMSTLGRRYRARTEEMIADARLR